MASIDLQKFNSMSFGKLDVHLDPEKRMTNDHANDNINKSMSKFNYLFDCESFDEVRTKLYKRNDEVDEMLPPGRLRKDRVVAVSYMTYCPKELESRHEEFFSFAHEWLKERLGSENVHGSFVHLDEKHQYLKNGEVRESLFHMHTEVSPYVEGVGINGKAYMTKAFLRDLHKDFNEALEVRFGIKDIAAEKDVWIKTVEEMKEKSLEEQVNLLKSISKGKEELAQERKEISQEREDIEQVKSYLQDDIVAVQNMQEELTLGMENLKNEKQAFESDKEIFNLDKEDLEIDKKELLMRQEQNEELEEELSRRSARLQKKSEALDSKESTLDEKEKDVSKREREILNANTSFVLQQEKIKREKEIRALQRKVAFYEQRAPHLAQEYEEGHKRRVNQRKYEREGAPKTGFKPGGFL